MNALAAIRSIAEHKYHDFIRQFDNITNPYVTNTSIVEDLCNIPQGNSDVERIGDKVTLTSLELRLVSYPPINVLTQEAFEYRVTLFIWKDDTFPSAGDVYQVPGAGGEIQNLPSTWAWNHDKKVKRKIIYDKTFSMVTGTNATNIISATPNAFNHYKTVIPFNGKKRNTIHYQSGLSTAVNKIYCIVTTSAPSGSVPATVIPHNIYYNVRINYIDM